MDVVYKIMKSSLYFAPSMYKYKLVKKLPKSIKYENEWGGVDTELVETTTHIFFTDYNLAISYFEEMAKGYIKSLDEKKKKLKRNLTLAKMMGPLPDEN